VNANSCIHTIKRSPLPILNDAVGYILEAFESCWFGLSFPNLQWCQFSMTQCEFLSYELLFSSFHGGDGSTRCVEGSALAESQWVQICLSGGLISRYMQKTME
jgi:hypothetical protein